MTEPISIGRRIAEQRKLRGWSQRELATRTGYSFSSVEKIERGLRSVDRYSTINAFAGALGIDPSELTGEAQRSKRHREHVLIPSIRRSLMAMPIGVPDGESRLLADLRDEVSKAITARESGRYIKFGEALPNLLEDLRRTVANESGQNLEIAYAMLVETLHGSSMLLRRIGYVDLAWIAVQQARGYADKAGDPLLIVANDWNAIELYIRAGNTTFANRLTEGAVSTLDRLIGVKETPQLISLLGTMHLLRSITAAQESAEKDVEAAMREAELLSSHLGRDRDDYQTQFGPSNTAVFGVSTAVELGHGRTALERTKRISVDAIPARERQARYLIDVARAYMQTANDGAATRVLEDAQKRAPEYVSNHLMAREAVVTLLERERKSLTPGLRTLAKKMGAL